VNDEWSTTSSGKLRAPKKTMGQLRIFWKTGCSRILGRFHLANHTEKALPCFIIRFVSGTLYATVELMGGVLKIRCRVSRGTSFDLPESTARAVICDAKASKVRFEVFSLSRETSKG
jgi:hypothetical protein